MRLAVRTLGLLLVWVAVAGTARSDLAVGLAAAVAAAAISVRAWPAGATRLRPLRLAGFALRMIGLAVLSGVDVARRALDPRARLRPGLVAVPVRLPPGAPRDLFLTIMSTVPGTLPAGAGGPGMVMVHCLDTGRPVAADFAAEEARFTRALGHRHQGGAA